jgi:hypothetical protein
VNTFCVDAALALGDALPRSTAANDLGKTPIGVAAVPDAGNGGGDVGSIFAGLYNCIQRQKVKKKNWNSTRLAQLNSKNSVRKEFRRKKWSGNKILVSGCTNATWRLVGATWVKRDCQRFETIQCRPQTEVIAESWRVAGDRLSDKIGQLRKNEEKAN